MDILDPTVGKISPALASVKFAPAFSRLRLASTFSIREQDTEWRTLAVVSPAFRCRSLVATEIERSSLWTNQAR